MQPTELQDALSAVFAYIDRHRESHLERLLDYLRMPSISAYGQGMGEVAAYLVAWLNRLGLHGQLLPTPGWPMVMGRRMDKPGKATVLLYGHYDVQPPDPLDGWLSPPFEPARGG
jgi:acetylornithine deacetylase/succinyl-diaminopimelate desuccinylase-like protein